MQETNIELGAWQITVEAVQEYLSAVGDDPAFYLENGTAPALMLAARVVGRLLEVLSLPDGAIHSLQDIETMNAPRIGVMASAKARVDPHRERGGMRFLTINYTVSDEDAGLELVQGRTTVLLPAGSASS